MAEKNELEINIVLDDSTQIIASIDESELVLFSSLRADTEPIKPYKLNTSGIEYPQKFESKCAICNSPHRVLLEHIYIEKNKRPNSVVKWFEEYFNAKLNFQQVKSHVERHCDFNKIEVQGLLDYEGREEELSRWKYREYELALTAVLVEINDIRGAPAKSFDDKIKRATLVDKLTSKLILIKQQRDDSSLGLPNVFEVLHEIHELMINENDKRIIREKVRELQDTIK